MPKGKYISIYIGKDETELFKGLDKFFKQRKWSRNEAIKNILLNFLWLAGYCEPLLKLDGRSRPKFEEPR